MQSGEFLGRLLAPLLKSDLSLMKNALKPLAKSVLIPLWLTAVASAVDVKIHKIKSGLRVAKIHSNKKMDDKWN